MPSGGSVGSAGFLLSGVQVLVLRALASSEDGLTAAELAAATSGARTMPVAPAVTALEARSLACGHERFGAGQHTAWAWSLTALGRRAAEAIRVVEGCGAVVEMQNSAEVGAR
ncbi:hypothetical protein NOVA_02725 [Nocardia nova]|uniref:hypothetical protein n=1 Tax=Nocardia nova TaxID=37330 RepID=UPI001C449F0B|nr:hypothetical protein [Nocardia nova]MBV7701676.1 hypothetical protein [Nocardia nova]